MFEFPPVNDSLGSLTPWRWVLLLCSFFASVALAALFVLLLRNHVMWVWPSLVCCAWAIAKMPMEVYAQNRRGRVVGKLYLGILVAYGAYSLYVGWNRIQSHFSEIMLLAILVVLLGLFWATYLIQVGTEKVNDQLLRRLSALQAQLDSIESKLKRL